MSAAAWAAWAVGSATMASMLTLPYLYRRIRRLGQHRAPQGGPIVAMFIEPSADDWRCLDVVVKNFGRRAAYGIGFDFDVAGDDSQVGSARCALPIEIPRLVPHQEYRMRWDSLQGHPALAGSDGARHEGAVSYFDEPDDPGAPGKDTRHRYSARVVLDRPTSPAAERLERVFSHDLIEKRQRRTRDQVGSHLGADEVLTDHQRITQEMRADIRREEMRPVSAGVDEVHGRRRGRYPGGLRDRPPRRTPELSAAVDAVNERDHVRPGQADVSQDATDKMATALPVAAQDVDPNGPGATGGGRHGVRSSSVAHRPRAVSLTSKRVPARQPAVMSGPSELAPLREPHVVTAKLAARSTAIPDALAGKPLNPSDGAHPSHAEQATAPEFASAEAAAAGMVPTGSAALVALVTATDAVADERGPVSSSVLEKRSDHRRAVLARPQKVTQPDSPSPADHLPDDSVRAHPDMRAGDVVLEPVVLASPRIRQIVEHVYTDYLRLPREWSRPQREAFLDGLAAEISDRVAALAAQMGITSVLDWIKAHGDHPDYRTHVGLLRVARASAQELTLATELYELIPHSADPRRAEDPTPIWPHDDDGTKAMARHPAPAKAGCTCDDSELVEPSQEDPVIQDSALDEAAIAGRRPPPENPPRTST